MSNTSNRWKSQGGINRRATNNILSNHKQATNTLTIPQQLGISNTTIEQYGDVHDISNTVLNNTQIGGTLDITGEMKVYNKSYFKNTAYFQAGVVDSCNTIIYDTSAVNHIDIFTTSDDTSHTASIFIQNAHGNANNDHHMPSMLVYNQEPDNNMSTASMENLIFSISGENVSVGEIYGQNTFDVGGNSSFLGKVGIGKSETSMVTLDSATLDVSGSVSISGGTSIYGSLDVSGICTMDQQSGFSSKNKINIIPIPNPLLTDFSGNTSDINMWGTFTNPDGTIYSDNFPRQTATIQSGYSNQINSKYGSDNLSEFYKGAWGSEYLSFKVGNYDSSSNMSNDSSMNSTTFSDIINVDLNNEVMRITAEGHVGIGTDSPTSTLDVSGNTTLSGTLDVSGVARFQEFTYGKTPEDDASGQEFPTCQWINSYIQADGGWITESINNGINGIYNSNIDKDKGYVGIGTKTPEYTLDVCGDIHMISGKLILEDGDISMNGSITADGSITVDGSITSNGSITTHSDITVDGSANIGVDMTIGGKVGIGLGTESIDPNFVLDISGDMYSNGNILTLGSIGIGKRGTTQNGKNEPEFALDVGGTMRVSKQVNFVGPVYGPAPSSTNAQGDGLQLVTMDWVTNAIGASGGWIASDTDNSIYNGNIDNKDAFVGIGTMTPQSTLDVSGNTTLRGTLDVTGDSIFHSDMDISQNKITVQDISVQYISASGNLNINGAITFSDNISIQSNDVSGSIAIGYNAGNVDQSANSIAIGNNVNTTAEYEIRIGDVSNNVVIPGTSRLNGGVHITGRQYQHDSIVDGKGVQPTGDAYPVEQGTHIQWSRDGGSGYTYIMNQKGSGTGGISFGDISDNNLYNELLFMGNVLPSAKDSYTTLNGTNSLKIYPSFRESSGYGGVGYAAQTIGVNIKPPDASGNIYQLAVSGGITGASAINFCADAESRGSNSAQFSIWTSPQEDSTSPLLQRVSVCGNGNVGIGVKEPTSTLDVSGTLSVTQGITCGDDGVKGTGIFVGSNDAEISYDEIKKTPCYIGVNYAVGQNEVDFHSISNYIDGTNGSWQNPNGGFNFYQWSSESQGTTPSKNLLCTINKNGFNLDLLATLNNGLDVVGNTTTSTLDVTGNTTTSTLDVTGNTTLKGALMVGDSTDPARYASLLDGDQATNAWKYLTFGKTNGIFGNQAELGFQWISDNAQTNKLSLGLYGVHVMYILSKGNVGIGTDNPVSKLEVNGTITSKGCDGVSDMRLKENIHDLSNSLEKICAIRGVEYNWKADEVKKIHIGVIAQEVKESIPEAVNTDNEEQYSVNYNAIIGHLIEAVKTLKQEVDDLKGQMKK
jgi:hypothetical protein